MTPQERAVVVAARAWANHPSDSRAQALQEAVRNLEAGLCVAQAVGGDPAWPHLFKCGLQAHEDNNHVDPRHGAWSKR